MAVITILAVGCETTDHARAFAGSALAILSPIVGFLGSGRQIIGSIVEGAVKG